MCRAGGRQLSEVNRRNEKLEHLIRVEQGMLDGQQGSSEYESRVKMEERELAIALERACAATRSEAQKAQVPQCKPLLLL